MGINNEFNPGFSVIDTGQGNDGGDDGKRYKLEGEGLEDIQSGDTEDTIIDSVDKDLKEGTIDLTIDKFKYKDKLVKLFDGVQGERRAIKDDFMRRASLFISEYIKIQNDGNLSEDKQLSVSGKLFEKTFGKLIYSLDLGLDFSKKPHRPVTDTPSGAPKKPQGRSYAK